METNLTPNHTLYIYDVQAVEYGDTAITGEPNELPALVEQTEGWENDSFADVNTGAITAQILPSNEFYIEKKGRLYGLLVQFSRSGTPDAHNWYRVASVRPGESLFDGTPDLVELTLTRIAPREADEES